MTAPAMRAVLGAECGADACADCTFAPCVHICHDTPPAGARSAAHRPTVHGGTRDRVFRELVTFHVAYGFAPTVRELADGVGLAVSTTAYHLRQLAAEGRVSMRPGMARTATPIRRTTAAA